MVNVDLSTTGIIQTYMLGVVSPYLIVIIIVGMAWFCYMCIGIGHNEGIKYVWNVGEKHSQIEHAKMFNRWTNGIED